MLTQPIQWTEGKRFLWWTSMESWETLGTLQCSILDLSTPTYQPVCWTDTPGTNQLIVRTSKLRKSLIIKLKLADIRRPREVNDIFERREESCRKEEGLSFTAIPLSGKAPGIRFAITLAKILKLGPRFRGLAHQISEDILLILGYYNIIRAQNLVNYPSI